MKKLNQYFDHTILKPEATEEDVIKLCQEAKEYGFYAVCVNSCYVPLAKKELEGSDVKIASVIGFPLGACSSDVKAYETDWACNEGADEIDMVIHVGALKEKRYEYVRDDINIVVAIADEHDAIVKVILETCLLTDDEIVKACELAGEAGAAFVKTSTGFSKSGATAHHVSLMKKTVGDSMEVKASGGIRDLKTTMEMIEAGADRIGASASVQIMKESQ
ncbi:deoxyribose-phosphate aldolase [Sinanaerobacter chloroacetimidivorans]|jgi:deoxyribose-phosphate aldolase|uniref:Deoxyribose-phosphate aldolase n=1 Tax=Sinanaerobacter chloroacetimidivorans TaxID=2818044 RepID=A0A8J7VY02_9FIRM|nr:deoxyribose-phosphate aldolase [Sinanaerobacter chloroacetimidivorans]MBR0597119.1 deoxyribose-phosphate aldolase [Sinanaerobacter chloroacetimidivorans]